MVLAAGGDSPLWFCLLPTDPLAKWFRTGMDGDHSTRTGTIGSSSSWTFILSMVLEYNWLKHPA